MALAAFLTSRRARLKPSEIGLPEGRRRTAGLRREEVASLAGVSVSWYTWLEQGREIRPSPETLKRIADVLRLDRADVVHLFALATVSGPPPLVGVHVPESMRLLVDAVEPVPAYVRNSRFDVLYWNSSVADLFVDYGGLEVSARNTLKLIFLHSPYRDLIVNWKEFAQHMLEVFRMSRAGAEDKAPFDELIAELNESSPEFREWWPSTDLKMFTEGLKCLQHPRRGYMEMSYLALTPLSSPEFSLVTFVQR